jgi:retron-type reverse transcriptase
MEPPNRGHSSVCKKLYVSAPGDRQRVKSESLRQERNSKPDRIGDRRINRLIRKWLKAGVMEEGELVSTETGTPQGAVASPLLANIYLHYVFDLWADQWAKAPCPRSGHYRSLRR